MFEPVETIDDIELQGIQKIYRFSNEYGASVIKHKFSYGFDDDLWELAVIRFNGPQARDFKICYTTPITNDVIGYLSDEEVEDLLKKISEL
jgi:hypothetical protein